MSSLKPENHTNHGWAGTTSRTPSLSFSPLSASASLSPLPQQRLPVNSLINNGSDTDEDAWAPIPSPNSRLSTPSENGFDSRPDVRQRGSATLPGFNTFIRLTAGHPTHPTTPAHTNPPVLAAAPPASTAAPLIHSSSSWGGWASYHQRPQLPPPPHPFPQHHHQAQPGAHPYNQHHQLQHQLQAPGPVQKKQRRPPTNPTGHPRTNRKYTQENIDFILYHRVDRKMSWTELIPAYNRQFPNELGRTTSGLQGSFYRFNLAIPLMDANGDLQFDENCEVITYASKVREQENEKIGLLARAPSRAMHYPWVDYRDRRNTMARGLRHERQMRQMKQRQQSRHGYP